MRPPISYFGGKTTHVRRLLPLLPPHVTYCEAFAGSLAVLFAKRQSAVEVVNDLDEGLVNFYRVLRSAELYPALARRLELVPYARAEQRWCSRTWQECDEPVERAARWFTAIRGSFASHSGAESRTSWSYVRADSARGMASAVSKWLSAIAGLPAAHARLRCVQVECDDWERVVARYDAPETLFFLDPPYVHETRGDHRYRHELSLADHGRLVEVVSSCVGMVVLCGHDHAVYAPLGAAGWHTEWSVVRVRAAGVCGRRRTEVVWVNPQAMKGIGR